MTPALSIVVLAFDEEENIGPVLAELFGWLDASEIDAEVIVVDDGSRDGTGDAAREALAGRPGTVVRHDRNRGMGAGLKTGTGAARGAWVTFLPADGQIPPEAVGTLWAAREGADVVLSVYADRDDGLVRKVLSFGVRALITAVHGVRLRSDGPYLFRRALLDPEQLAPDTFFLNFELPIRALGAGLGVHTVTIPCRARRAGVSKSASFGRAFGVARDLVAMRGRVTREALARWGG
ncbi:MAG: glycosyltransferase family 2 protein [Myxococcales bacterium]|nr:glycosyltransferase family 2 protein [Myxococcales bacterium]